MGVFVPVEEGDRPCDEAEALRVAELAVVGHSSATLLLLNVLPGASCSSQAGQHSVTQRTMPHER